MTTYTMMTHDQAMRTNIGATVNYGGRDYKVVSINAGLIWGPHFRLAPLDINDPDSDGHDLTSYRLLSLPVDGVTDA